MTLEEAKAKILHWCSVVGATIPDWGTSMPLYRLFYASRAMVALFILSGAATTQTDVLNAQYKAGIGPSEKIQLPQPFATPSASNASKLIGWPKGRMPTPPVGFEVSLFAEDLHYPRLAYVLPNEDILVVEVGSEFPDHPQKVNRITLFRDTNKRQA